MLTLALALSLISVDPMPAAKPEAPLRKASVQMEAPQPLSGVRVSLECMASRDGRVADCVVLEETRPGLGFGAAAIALMNGSPIRAGQPSPVALTFATVLIWFPKVLGHEDAALLVAQREAAGGVVTEMAELLADGL